MCILGDTLDGDGGADLAATARIGNGWMKFREFLPFLTSRAPPLERKGRVYASCVRSSMGVDEWLIRTVMALYTEVCTVVRTDAGLSESFEVKLGLHQWSVLSPLLFAAVMDVVSSEARRGLPSELLYADDLVIMAPKIEQLGRRVADWRASLLGQGLKVNVGKSKVMVGSSGGKMIVNSGKWLCGVCGKGVQTNSVQCTVCKKMDSQTVQWCPW